MDRDTYSQKSEVMDSNEVGIGESKSDIWHMWNQKFAAVEQRGTGKVEKLQATAKSRTVSRCEPT